MHDALPPGWRVARLDPRVPRRDVEVWAVNMRTTGRGEFSDSLAETQTSAWTFGLTLGDENRSKGSNLEISGRLARRMGEGQGRKMERAQGVAFRAEVIGVESGANDGRAVDELTSGARVRGFPGTARSVLVNLAAAMLLVVGSFGLLGVPIVAMFSEGIPDSWSNNEGAYIGLWAAVSVAFIVAGIGVSRGRGWARFLGIGLYIFAALDPGSVLLSFISVAFALVLVFAWRPRAGSQRPAP